jgi:hypothetical protein
VRPHPFRAVSGLAHTSHGALALALSAELGDVDLDTVDAELDRLARRVAPAARAGAARRLGAAGLGLRGAQTPAPPRRTGDLDDLRLDRVVLSGRGNLVLCALAGIEVARRAGLELGLVASKTGAFVGDPRAGAPWLLSPARDWTLVDARELGDPSLAWYCPHEGTGIVLGLLAARAERCGLVGVQLRAAELALALPVHADAQARLEDELARVRARMN